jgi:hypothetical protein
VSFEPVDFLVKDSTPLENPVEGVLVRIYNEAGTIFFSQATTNVDGGAGFLLETQKYSARFYKFQVGFNQPQILEVLVAPAINIFDIQAEVFVLPIASDPRFCRASGFFRSVSGAPDHGVDMHFQTTFNPLLLESSGIIDTKDSIRTDENGYAQIDLIRGAIYHVFLQGLEECPRKIRVPDQASVNLPDLLFPVVQAVSFVPPGPYALTVGVEIEVTPTVLSSDGVLLEGTALQDVLWRTGNSDIASVSPSDTKLVLRGNAVGATTLTVERADKSIIRIPNIAVQGQPVNITVT